MRVSVDGPSLAAAMKITAQPASARLMPVLQGVMITAADELVFSTFDLETAAAATASSAVIADPGRALVSHRLLAQVAAQCGPTEVVLDDSGDTRGLRVTAGRAAWRLPVMPPEDYPSLPSVDEHVATLSAGDFAAAVDRVAPAAADEPPPFDAVRIVFERDRITLAATDRYRVHIDELPALCAPITGMTLIPAKRLQSMVKHLGGGKLTLTRSAGILAVTAPHAKLSTRLLDAENNYPPVDNLVQGCNDQRKSSAVLDRDELQRALRQVGAFAEDGGKGHRHLTLTFDEGELLIKAGTDTEGSGSAAVGCGLDGQGLRLVCDLGYMLDLLGTVPEPQIRFTFTGPTKPLGIGTLDGPSTSILMPIRRDGSEWLGQP